MIIIILLVLLLLHPGASKADAPACSRPARRGAVIGESPASRRGQDKQTFYRSAIDSHDNAIIMP